MTNGDDPNNPQQNNPSNVDQTQKSLDLQQLINENLGIAEEFRKEENRLLAERLEMIDASFQQAQKILENNRTMTKELSDQYAMMSRLKMTEEERLNAEQEMIELRQELVENLKNQKQAQQALEDIEKERLRQIMEINKALLQNQISSEQAAQQIADANKQAAVDTEKLRAGIADTDRSAKKGVQAFGDLSKSLGISSDVSTTMIGKMKTLSAEFSTGFNKDKIAMLKTGLAEQATALVYGLVDSLVKASLEVQKLSMEFQQAQGFTRDFHMEISKATAETYNMGLSFKDSQKALTNLAENFSDFGTTSGETNTHMMTSVSLLTKFGVTAGQSTKGAQLLSKSLKMNGKDAIDAYSSIVTSGQAASISAKKMASDFEANFKDMVQFGREAETVFKKLAAQSKATGVAMNGLVTIAKKFDTFEGAAEQAAKLNSFLGGNVSAMELMNADYAETIELIRDGMGGIEFDNLNRFEQQYLQTALGAESLAEAQMLLSGDTDGTMAKMEQLRQSQENLKNMVMETIPVFERLMIGLKNLYMVFEPIIRMISNFFDALGALDDLLLEFTDGAFGLTQILQLLIGLLVVKLAAPMAVFVGGVMLLITVLDYLGDLFTELAPQLEILWRVLKVIGFVVGVIILVSLLKLGAVIGPVIIAIMGIVYALNELWEMLHKEGSPMLFMLLIKYIPDGFEAMASTAERAVGALAKLGKALLEIYTKAMQPFLKGFKMLGGMLGFDVDAGEDPEGAEVKGANIKAGATNATLAQAATEIKTLVVAQLKETGIQATADELAKIARIMSEKEPVTNVVVNIDGKAIMETVYDKLSDII